MGFPEDVGAVDLMIGFPFKDERAVYESLRAQTRDDQSRGEVWPKFLRENARRVFELEDLAP